jgi:hypothetical protein
VNRLVQKIVAALALVALWLGFVPDAAACAACFGRSNDAMITAYYIGGAVLVGVVLAVFGGIVAFGIHMNRRSAQQAAAPEDLTESAALTATSK